jgi:hypothetical protein
MANANFLEVACSNRRLDEGHLAASDATNVSIRINGGLGSNLLDRKTMELGGGDLFGSCCFYWVTSLCQKSDSQSEHRIATEQLDPMSMGLITSHWIVRCLYSSGILSMSLELRGNFIGHIKPCICKSPTFAPLLKRMARSSPMPHFPTPKQPRIFISKYLSHAFSNGSILVSVICYYNCSTECSCSKCAGAKEEEATQIISRSIPIRMEIPWKLFLILERSGDTAMQAAFESVVQAVLKIYVNQHSYQQNIPGSSADMSFQMSHDFHVSNFFPPDIRAFENQCRELALLQVGTRIG